MEHTHYFNLFQSQFQPNLTLTIAIHVHSIVVILSCYIYFEQCFTKHILNFKVRPISLYRWMVMLA